MKKPAELMGRTQAKRVKLEPIDAEALKSKAKAVKVESAELPQVEDKIVLQALRALKRLNEIHDEKKKTLFVEAVPIVMQIDCVKIPKCPARKLRFTLPHWLVTDTSEICLFVADMKKGKRVDHEPTVEHYEDMLRNEGITNIKSVVPIRQVRVEFDQMEMKRRLLTQYDFFLADARVSGMLAHKLGTTFFRKNQMPTPVKIHEGNVKQSIEKALHKTTMKLHSAGNTFAMRVAHGAHSEKEACQNVQAVLSQLVQQLPGGWENVRSVYLKNPLSMAIPLYVTLKNQNLIKRTRIEPLHSIRGFEEGDLSTSLGTTVRVYANGKVSVKRKRKNSEEDDDKENADQTSDKEADDSVKEIAEETKDNNGNADNKEDSEVSNDEEESEIEEPVIKKKKLVKTEKAKKNKLQKVKEVKPKKEKSKKKT